MAKVEIRGQATDKRGRLWTAKVVPRELEAEEDFRFWQSMTPAQRVNAVGACLLSTLKTQGIHELPRLRRVCRVIERPWG